MSNHSDADRDEAFSAAQLPAFVRRLDEALQRNRELLPDRSLLLALSRRSVELTTTTRESYSRVGNTRFGGEPDLPRGFAYPMDGDVAFVFLAQIDLAEIAEYQDYLPRTGLLSFFASDLEYVQEARVLYHPAETQLERCPFPEDAIFDRDEPFEGFHARAVQAWSLPPTYLDLVRIAKGERTDEEAAADDQLYDAYERLRETCCPQRPAQENDAHGINVYVITQLDSPEQEAAEKAGGEPGDWKVLLSLGFDKNTEFCFWDAGTLSFMIRREDLAACRFSRVVAFIESS